MTGLQIDRCCLRSWSPLPRKARHTRGPVHQGAASCSQLVDHLLGPLQQLHCQVAGTCGAQHLVEGTRQFSERGRGAPAPAALRHRGPAHHTHACDRYCLASNAASTAAARRRPTTPGPISSTTSVDLTPALSTIDCTTSGFFRMCWPLLLWNSMPAGEMRGMRLERQQAVATAGGSGRRQRRRRRRQRERGALRPVTAVIVHSSTTNS